MELDSYKTLVIISMDINASGACPGLFIIDVRELVPHTLVMSFSDSNFLSNTQQLVQFRDFCVDIFWLMNLAYGACSIYALIMHIQVLSNTPAN